MIIVVISMFNPCNKSLVARSYSELKSAPVLKVKLMWNLLCEIGFRLHVYFYANQTIFKWKVYTGPHFETVAIVHLKCTLHSSSQSLRSFLPRARRNIKTFFNENFLGTRKANFHLIFAVKGLLERLLITRLWILIQC